MKLSLAFSNSNIMLLHLWGVVNKCTLQKERLLGTTRAHFIVLGGNLLTSRGQASYKNLNSP